MYKRIIFDEKKEALKILENGLPDTLQQFYLNIVSKYLRSLKMEDSEIGDVLAKLLLEKNPYFNRVLSKGRIDDAVDISKRYVMKRVYDVAITKNEMETLRKFDYRYGKLLFTMLVISKFDKFNSTESQIENAKAKDWGYVCNYDMDAVCDFAKIRMTKQQKHDFTTCMDRDNRIISANQKGQYFKLFFSIDDKDLLFVISDFDDIYKYFPKLCDKCGEELDNPNHKYCASCKLENRTEQNRKYVSENYRRKINSKQCL